MHQWQVDVRGRRYLEEGSVRVVLDIGERFVHIDTTSTWLTVNARYPVGIYSGEALDEEVERQFEQALHFNNRVKSRLPRIGAK